MTTTCTRSTVAPECDRILCFDSSGELCLTRYVPVRIVDHARNDRAQWRLLCEVFVLIALIASA
ncbi:MAG: hypothetical protein ACKV0T_17630 [Planctomycetales bacterium]